MKKPAVFVAVAVGLLISLPLAATFVLDSLGGSWSGMATTVTGTGGSGCEVATRKVGFTPQDDVRVLAEYSPDLRAGTNATVHVFQNGTERSDLAMVRTFDSPTGCIYGDLGALAPGHYVVEFAADSTQMPPIRAEFDVRN